MCTDEYSLGYSGIYLYYTHTITYIIDLPRNKRMSAKKGELKAKIKIPKWKKEKENPCVPFMIIIFN